MEERSYLLEIEGGTITIVNDNSYKNKALPLNYLQEKVGGYIESCLVYFKELQTMHVDMYCNDDVLESFTPNIVLTQNSEVQNALLGKMIIVGYTTDGTAENILLTLEEVNELLKIFRENFKKMLVRNRSTGEISYALSYEVSNEFCF